MAALHVVTGAGPVGWTVAQQLAEAGNDVRVLTRSGSGPEHPRIERRKVDVSKPDQLDAAFAGAVAVFHAIHGSAYSTKTWRAELPAAERVVLDVAGRAGAVVVFPESLYSYGKVDRPMTEDMRRDATDGKLGVRAELLRARAASSTPTVSVVASDFYGPRVLTAHAGERLVPTILDGKTMRVIGSLDQPHSFTYIPDYAATMIAAAHDRSLWDTVLHAPTAPAVTQRRLIDAFAAAGGVAAPKMSAVPTWVLRAGGVVSSDMKELAETAYQFDRPFVMDSSRAEKLLGLRPTPLVDGSAAEDLAPAAVVAPAAEIPVAGEGDAVEAAVAVPETPSAQRPLPQVTGGVVFNDDGTATVNVDVVPQLSDAEKKALADAEAASKTAVAASAAAQVKLDEAKAADAAASTAVTKAKVAAAEAVTKAKAADEVAAVAKVDALAAAAKVKTAKDDVAARQKTADDAKAAKAKADADAAAAKAEADRLEAAAKTAGNPAAVAAATAARADADAKATAAATATANADKAAAELQTSLTAVQEAFKRRSTSPR